MPVVHLPFLVALGNLFIDFGRLVLDFAQIL